MQRLTNSSITCFAVCQRKYGWRYERHIQPVTYEEGDALRNGISFHHGIEIAQNEGIEFAAAAVRQSWAEKPALGDDIRRNEQEVAKVCAMIRAAVARWSDKLKLTECSFEIPLVNPETGGKSRSFMYAGKWDGVAGSRLVDWKTTADPDKFILEKRLGYQFAGYAAGLGAQGLPIHLAEYRLVTRPTIRLKDANRSRKVNQTPDEYEAECLAWLDADPGRLREEIVYLHPGAINGWRWWAWEASKAILEARRYNRWTRNIHACNAWRRECEYLPLCLAEAQGEDPEQLIAERYEVTEPHPELSKE